MPAAISPLRYAGGKTRMAQHILNLTGAVGRIVEPFCGGASVSLRALDTGQCTQAHLADADPDLMAFWVVATGDSEALIGRMNEEPVTIDRWHHWQSAQPGNDLERAVRYLFLNRTSFSGIVRKPPAGPIGGMSQNGKYKIDCRFNKTGIAARIRQVAAWHELGVLTVSRDDYQATIHSTQHADVLYLDPPYIEKAQRLYECAFTEDDHRALAKTLTECSTPWFLSYDDTRLVRELYKGHHIEPVGHTYSAAGKKDRHATGREIIITNTQGEQHHEHHN